MRGAQHRALRALAASISTCQGRGRTWMGFAGENHPKGKHRSRLQKGHVVVGCPTWAYFYSQQAANNPKSEPHPHKLHTQHSQIAEAASPQETNPAPALHTKRDLTKSIPTPEQKLAALMDLSSSWCSRGFSLLL